MGAKYYRILESADGLDIEFPDWSTLMLSPSQADYFFDESRRELLCAGRGYGKGHVPLLKKLTVAFDKVMERAADPTWNRPGLVWHLAIVAPTEKNLAENWDKLRDYVPVIPGMAPDGSKNYRCLEREQRFELFGRNQLRISLFSAWEPKTLRGPGFDDCLCDEAMNLKRKTFFSNVVPMVFRTGYEGRCTLAGSPDTDEIPDPWFDAACDEADPACPAREGYFSNWKLHTGTAFDNPAPRSIDEEEQMRRVEMANPNRYRREYLGERHLIVSDDEEPDRPIHPGLLDCAYTSKLVTLTGPPLVSWDLAYGGEDKTVRAVWDVATCTLLQLDIWTADQLRMDPANPHLSLVKLFEQTAALPGFGGCLQVYDGTGRQGPYLSLHLPPRLRVRSVAKNNAVKVRQVSSMLERLQNVGPDGKSLGMRIPDPKLYPFRDERQRENIVRLVGDLLHYKRTTPNPFLVFRSQATKRNHRVATR